jgi:Carboxypeptidase regulatory-like domain
VRGSVAGAATGSVRVSLVPRGGIPYAELLSVETSDGTFQFKNVLPGDYTVLATSQNTDEMLEGRTTITVEDHDLTAVSVVLKKRMDHRRLWVHVEGAVSIQDVVISLHRAFTSEEDSVIVAEDDLAEQGSEISTRGGNPIDLPCPGPFVVSVEKLPADFYIEHADFKSETSGPQTTESLDVSLSSDGARVEGIVLDSADHPVPGAVVVAIPDRQQNNVDQSRTTTTDQYGQFTLRGLVPTTHKIYAWEEMPDGAFHDPDFLADYGDGAQGISAQSGNRNPVILHVLHAASSQQD